MIDVSVTRLHQPGVVVVDGVNWSVRPGDYWVVGGRHHSGKSDLMMTGAALVPPHRGVCRVFGQVPDATPALGQARRHLGFVFDGGQLLNHLTVKENIALPLCYHRDCPPEAVAGEVDALLELTELQAVADLRPAAVGRNWRQRAGLARALAARPDVLLLDSPLSGLDPADLEWWLDLLDALSAGHAWMEHRPLTLVASADHLRPWLGRARQFALIKDGRWVAGADGARAALEHDPLWRELTATGVRTTSP
ncbi:MAG TPA: ATP-binding cassette domain-containing protein [Methylomirabilota bacterium]|nr:ATP-binding cassette domain-containing protein [Methylomirabilota bacterium]